MTKMPLSESNSNATAATPSRHDSIKTKTVTPSKRRQVSIDQNPSSPSIKNHDDDNGSFEKSKHSLHFDTKENDLALEISITTGSNVHVIIGFWNVFFFSSWR